METEIYQNRLMAANAGFAFNLLISLRFFAANSSA